MSSRKNLRSLNTNAYRSIDSLMTETQGDIQKWETQGQLPEPDFFEHDKKFIKSILHANTLAHFHRVDLEELLQPNHLLPYSIVLSALIEMEDFPHLRQRRELVDESCKKSDPLWAIQFFATSSDWITREFKMRLVEAEKITDPESVQDFLAKYALRDIESRNEKKVLMDSLKHPSLRKFLGEYNDCAEEYEGHESSMFIFQLDYDNIRLYVHTDGENYFIPTLQNKPQWKTLSELLGWLKDAKKVSDDRMRENLRFRLSPENPNKPYAVMSIEDVSLLIQNPFYSFKWFVDGYESNPSTYFSFPLGEDYPDCTYEISQLAYRVHTDNLVLGIPEIDGIFGSRMTEAIDANIDIFRLAVSQGYVSPALSVETHIYDPISGPFEETFQYTITGEGMPSDGEFFFTCDKIGFGDDQHVRVIFELEKDYPNKSFNEIFESLVELISDEIRSQNN